MSDSVQLIGVRKISAPSWISRRLGHVVMGTPGHLPQAELGWGWIGGRQGPSRLCRPFLSGARQKVQPGPSSAMMSSGDPGSVEGDDLASAMDDPALARDDPAPTKVDTAPAQDDTTFTLPGARLLFPFLPSTINQAELLDFMAMMSYVKGCYDTTSQPRSSIAGRTDRLTPSVRHSPSQ